MAYNIVNRDFLVQSFNDYNKYALHTSRQVKVVDTPAKYESSTDPSALTIVDDSTVTPGVGEVGISTVEAVSPGQFSVGDTVVYVAEVSHYETEWDDTYLKVTKIPDHVQAYTSTEIERLFDGTAEEISYYKSLIDDDKTSKYYLWSSNKISGAIQQGVISASQYADSLFASQAQLNLKYVTTLPSVGSSTTIYILQPTTTGANPTLNLYDESEAKWNTIGEFKAVMTDYYTKSEITTQLADYAKKTDALLTDDVETTPINFNTDPWS